MLNSSIGGESKHKPCRKITLAPNKTLWHCLKGNKSYGACNISSLVHSREIIKPESKGEQPQLHVSHQLGLIYMPTKYHQNISMGIVVMECIRCPLSVIRVKRCSFWVPPTYVLVEKKKKKNLITHFYLEVWFTVRKEPVYGVPVNVGIVSIEISWCSNKGKSKMISWLSLNPLLHNNAFWLLWNIMYLKILWKMEHLLFWSNAPFL